MVRRWRTRRPTDVFENLFSGLVAADVDATEIFLFGFLFLRGFLGFGPLTVGEALTLHHPRAAR